MFEKQSDRQDHALVDRRVLQYSMVDGLYELAMGSMFLFLAVAVLLGITFPDIFPALMFLPVFLGIVLVTSSVSRLKRRLTYPRTGYATSRYPRYLKPLVFFGLVFASGLLILLPLFVPRLQLTVDQAFFLFVGVLITGMLLWLGAGLARFYVLAAISFFLSVALIWLPLESSIEYLTYFITMGLLLIASGAFTLSRYLGKNS